MWTQSRAWNGITRLLIVVGVCAAAVAVASQTVSAATQAGGPQAAEEMRLLELINQERTARGLAPVSVNLQLTRLARLHSKRMAAAVSGGGRCGDGSTLRHRSPLSDGVSASWTMLRENVACNRPVDVERLHESLMDSPDHRVNILASDVRFVGIGVWHDDDYGLWVTQTFMGSPTEPVQMSTIREGIRAAKARFSDGRRPDVVALSRSDVFADSIGGAALTGSVGATLFTPPPSSVEPNPVLHPATRAEIDRLLGGTGTVYVLGGAAAISPRVETELQDAGYTVRRLAGPDRFATATAVAEETVRLHGAPERIVIANGGHWSDAVGAWPATDLAGMPVVLSRQDSLPVVTQRFLAAHPQAERVVLGGTGAVTDDLLHNLDAGRLAVG